MQAIDLWDGDDSSDAAMLNRAGVGAILVERKMSAELSLEKQILQDVARGNL